MVEGGMKCVKYLLFAFNLIFFLCGLALIIVGAVVQTRMKDYFDFIDSSSVGVAIVVIIVGCIIFVIGFFGCCGAYKENYCMTMTFAVLLMLIFILEIAAGIAAYVMRNELETTIRENMDSSMKNYGKAENQGVTDTWDSVQKDFKCCGANASSDWDDILNDRVPDSCCREDTEGCGADKSATNIYTNGCYDAFVAMVKDNIIIIGGVGVGLAFIQIFGVLLACCLARSIKKEYEVV